MDWVQPLNVLYVMKSYQYAVKSLILDAPNPQT